MKIHNRKKMSIKTELPADLLVHACSPRTLEAETRGLPQVQGPPDYTMSLHNELQHNLGCIERPYLKQQQVIVTV